MTLSQLPTRQKDYSLKVGYIRSSLVYQASLKKKKIIPLLSFSFAVLCTGPGQCDLQPLAPKIQSKSQLMKIFLNTVALGVDFYYATHQQVFFMSNNLKTLKMFLSKPVGRVNVMDILVVAVSLWS